MANNEKFCPLIKQACINNQCEFFNDLIKRCQISVLSYNTYRLAESMKDKPGNKKDQTSLTFGNRETSGNPPPNLPFS
jgi:hypothetical protein